MTEQEAKDKWLELYGEKYNGWIRLGFTEHAAYVYSPTGTPDKPREPILLCSTDKQVTLNNFDFIAPELMKATLMNIQKIKQARREEYSKVNATLGKSKE